MERRTHQSTYDLLLQDQYTPEEVAQVLGIGLDVVRHAAFTGALPAQVVGHDIISIRRDDVLDWLRATEGPDGESPADARG